MIVPAQTWAEPVAAFLAGVTRLRSENVPDSYLIETGRNVAAAVKAGATADEVLAVLTGAGWLPVVARLMLFAALAAFAPRHLRWADPETGKPRMTTVKCTTCPFRPAFRHVITEGGARDLAAKKVNCGDAMTCHETIGDGLTAVGGELPLIRSGGGTELAICRGFHDVFRGETAVLTIAGLAGGFTECEPPPADQWVGAGVHLAYRGSVRAIDTAPEAL